MSVQSKSHYFLFPLVSLYFFLWFFFLIFFFGFSLLNCDDIMWSIKQCAISWSKQRDIHGEAAYARETLCPIAGPPSRCGSDLGSETVPLGEECSVPFHHNSLPRSSLRPLSFLSLSRSSFSPSYLHHHHLSVSLRKQRSLTMMGNSGGELERVCFFLDKN